MKSRNFKTPKLQNFKTPRDMIPTETDILTLIPQRPPFVMVDRLEHCDERVTVTTFLVRSDNLFLHQGRLTTPGLVENMAQTCAARMGWLNVTSGKPVRIGVIGAIRHWEMHELPPEGATLTTRIEVLEEVFQMTLVSAVTEFDGRLAATATMKIALR